MTISPSVAVAASDSASVSGLRLLSSSPKYTQAQRAYRPYALLPHRDDPTIPPRAAEIPTAAQLSTRVVERKGGSGAGSWSRSLAVHVIVLPLLPLPLL